MNSATPMSSHIAGEDGAMITELTASVGATPTRITLVSEKERHA